MKYIMIVAVTFLLATMFVDGMISYHLNRDWTVLSNKIDKCEESLPRNKHCQLVAIPESNQESE